ncbi:flagellar biosynthesis protein, partial [Chlamydia suis]
MVSPHLHSLSSPETPPFSTENSLLEEEALSHELLSLVQVFRKLSIHLLSEIEKVSQKI